MQHIHGNIPYLFDFWSDWFVHVLPLKSLISRLFQVSRAADVPKEKNTQWLNEMSFEQMSVGRNALARKCEMRKTRVDGFDDRTFTSSRH